MPELKILLEHAAAVDASINMHNVKIGKAILSVPPQETVKPPKPSELSLEHEDDDPFNGNVNNRKVAERIAAQNRTIYTNVHKIIHTGDPGKAARDVAKSKAINPDALTDNELEEAQAEETARKLREVKPTPGSPAAVKAEADAKAAQGVTATPASPAAPVIPWKPNAGPAK